MDTADDKFELPVIDFSEYSLALKEEDVSNNGIRQLAEQICHAFRTVGFLYLKNHGIPDSKIVEMQTIARKFFTAPEEVKAQYGRQGKGLESNHGWVTVEREVLNPERPGDLKEAYDIIPHVALKWPDDVAPGFKSFMLEMFESCSVLSNRLHYLIGVGLNLKDPELFRKNHNPSGPGCSTAGRLLYYPVVKDNEIKPNQIRCGEHTDYGSITLLFQDDVGGLEVMNRKGEFVPAKPIPGTIVVNVADLMQRWTSDQLVSTTHRVVKPTSEIGCTQGRISFAFFVQPDDDCVIECIDGSNKYEPITSGAYLDMRLRDTYAY